MSKLDRRLEMLGQSIRDMQDGMHAQIDATRLSRRARFVERARGRARPSRAVWAYATAVVAVAAAIVALVTWPRSSLVFDVDGVEAGGRTWVAATDQAVSVSFSDGSTVEVRPRARARFVADADEAAVALERGTLALRVDPQTDAHWQVEAGPYRVHVTGTVFTVQWQPQEQRIAVAVERGAVRVQGPGLAETTVVTAGRRLDAVAPDTRLERSVVRGEGSIDAQGRHPTPGSLDSEEAPQEDREAAKPRTRPKSKPSSSVPGPPRWHALAEAGDHQQAFAEAESIGFGNLCRRESADALVRLADVARYASHARQAREVIDCVRRRFPRSKAARRAAYTRGRVEFDLAKDYEAAARWFQVYLKENPRGPLRREAMGRRLESLLQAHETKAARALARDYLDAYPRGPHADVARSAVH